MDTQQKTTGGCLCGAIRYESDVEPYIVGFCHCKMCQKGVGNVFGTAAFFKHATFRFIQGSLKWHKSDSAQRGFCVDCGSPIAFQRNGFEDDYFAIWVGTLDHPEGLQPTAEWHTESMLPWVRLQSNLKDATPASTECRYDTMLDT